MSSARGMKGQHYYLLETLAECPEGGQQRLGGLTTRLMQRNVSLIILHSTDHEIEIETAD
jgi:hypothetical protein